MTSKPIKLIYDIETAPCLVTVWGLKQDGYISPGNIERDKYIICASWKEHAKAKTYKACVTSKHPQDDKKVVQALHSALSNADEIIHHNGDSFDLPTLRDRAIYHGLGPLPPVVQTDTKKIAKSLFRFTSNSLDYLGKYLGVGNKIKTDYDLWKECVKGNQKALNYMQDYNVQDVLLLERVYNKLVAWAPAKLNHNLFTAEDGCPSCSSLDIQKRGVSYTRTGVKQRYVCKECGHWSTGVSVAVKGVLR
jgi:hypothetical protein